MKLNIEEILRNADDEREFSGVEDLLSNLITDYDEEVYNHSDIIAILKEVMILYKNDSLYNIFGEKITE